MVKRNILVAGIIDSKTGAVTLRPGFLETLEQKIPEGLYVAVWCDRCGQVSLVREKTWKGLCSVCEEA